MNRFFYFNKAQMIVNFDADMVIDLSITGQFCETRL